MMRRVDWLLPVTALAGFALAWFARHAMDGSVATRAQLVGIGKAVGYVAILIFVIQLVRRRS